MEIVDAQVHAPLPLEPWPAGFADRDLRHVVSAELANAAMEAVGVDAAVLYAGLEQCAAAHQRYPARFGGVISVDDPDDPAQLPSPALLAERVRSTPGILGFRILAGSPDGTGRRLARLAGGRWEPTLAAAERAGIPVVLFAPLHMPLVAAVAAAHPELRLVVDHLGLPPPPAFPASRRFFDTIPQLLALARAPNVAVKLTGAPALSAAPYPFDDLWPVLHQILGAFGPDRVMWGSDFTRVTGRSQHPRHPGGRYTYAELVGYLGATGELDPAEKAALFGGTVRAWFGWHPGPPAPAGQTEGPRGAS
jgi:predicted TIM-barrel fold metal-dependent hydrolase